MAPWAPYFTSLDIENSLSDPHAELWPQLQKLFAKPPLKKIILKSPDLVYRTAAPPIAAENCR